MGNFRLLKATSRWLQNSQHSLAHNVIVLRRLLGAWGRTLINHGNQDVWELNAEEMETNGATEGANLRMDSKDFSIREGRWRRQRTVTTPSSWIACQEDISSFLTEKALWEDCGRLITQDTRFQVVRGEQADSGKGLWWWYVNCRPALPEAHEDNWFSSLHYARESQLAVENEWDTRHLRKFRGAEETQQTHKWGEGPNGRLLRNYGEEVHNFSHFVSGINFMKPQWKTNLTYCDTQ